MMRESTFLTVYILTVAAVLGAVFGSFINCMAWRIAHGEKISGGRSHCAVCGHTLGALDLIPVFSYLFLWGRCRYCGEKISFRYPATELALALAFMLCAWHFDLTWTALEAMGLACILLGLSLVDLEIYEIPDRFILAGILWWGIWTLQSYLSGQAQEGALIRSLLGGLALGGGLLVLSLIFDKVTGKEGLGGGDIKLFFMVGLYLGPAVGLFSLIIACFTGILFVILLHQEKIPFGPAISLASFIGLLWGNQAVDWYLGLFI